MYSPHCLGLKTFAQLDPAFSRSLPPPACEVSILQVLIFEVSPERTRSFSPSRIYWCCCQCVKSMSSFLLPEKIIFIIQSPAVRLTFVRIPSVLCLQPPRQLPAPVKATVLLARPSHHQSVITVCMSVSFPRVWAIWGQRFKSVLHPWFTVCAQQRVGESLMQVCRTSL